MTESFFNGAAMTRRDAFKLAGAATAMAAGASLIGCSQATAAPAKDTALAAGGAASTTLEEATSYNVMKVETNVPSINLTAGIVYKQLLPGGNQLHVDMLVPSGEKGTKFPLIVYINGGGFTGSLPSRGITQRMAFAEAGYVVASIQHRVVPSARFPEPLEDVKAAVRWLRAHAADYSIDPERVGVVGSSAGGYFATMLGVTGDVKEFDVGDHTNESSAVNAVIDLYGVSDLTIIGAGLPDGLEEGHDSPATTEAMLVNGTAFGGNKGASVFDTPEAAAEASPFTYIDGTDPAFLILHGDKDTLVSPVASMELYKRLKDAGVDVERYTIEGAGHGGPLFDQPAVIDLMVEFLDKNVKNIGQR